MTGKLAISINFILHATEDALKVCGSIKDTLGVDPGFFSTSQTHGHHDNPITTMSAKISGGDATEFMERLLEVIPAEELVTMRDDIGDLISASGLDLRFDKQDLVEGRLTTRKKGSVRIKILAPVYRKSETVRVYRDLLGGASGRAVAP